MLPTLVVVARPYFQMFSGVSKCTTNPFHSLLCGARSSRILFFVQASSLSKLSNPPSNALTMGRINAEFCSKSTLNRDNGVCFRKLQHTKCLLLRSRHFGVKKRDPPRIQWCQKNYYPQR